MRAAGSAGVAAMTSSLLYSGSAASTPYTGNGRWANVAFGDILAGGDLAVRARKNQRRLQHPAYGTPKAFASSTADSWPGDWVGRALLGKTLLARSLGENADDARRLIGDLQGHLNPRGYLGPVIDSGTFNEQQIGAHGWLIGGLAAFSDWTHELEAQQMLAEMVHNLARPLRDSWSSYPLTSAVRRQGAGGVIGNAEWRHGPWLLSTDIGSIFILLEGLSRAWALSPNAELRAVIDAGIDRFMQMDLMAVQAQTHAVLTTLRALLRVSALTGDDKLLRAVEDRYGLYRSQAMTESYANYNYFGRPRTWTEPCGIIDSFMIAMQLWQLTSKPQYLEDAHLIWINGVGRGQRPTGGFGCDSCAGVDVPFMKLALMYEAYSCCTMRGGEGHSYAIQSAYHTRSGELAVTYYTDSRATLQMGHDRLVLEQSTQYPYEGDVRIKVVSSTVRGPLNVRLFVPPWMTNARLSLNARPVEARQEQGFLVMRLVPRAGDVISLESSLKHWERPAQNPNSLAGYRLIHAGPLLLGYDGDVQIALPETLELRPLKPGRFQVRGTDIALAGINDVHEGPLPRWDPLDVVASTDADEVRSRSGWLLSEAHGYRRQVMFRGTGS
jgi:hypothetical protein